MPSTEWMFDRPLQVLPFAAALIEADRERGILGPEDPDPILVRFQQARTQWTAGFVVGDGDFYMEKKGNVQRSRDWFEKRIAERAKDE